MAPFWPLVVVVWFVLAVSAVAAVPDALQDFCVADTSSSATFMTGLPCLNPNMVTPMHFMTSDLGIPTNTSVSPARVNGKLTSPQNMPGINTLGLSMLRVDAAVGGVVPPHVHPRATEMVFVVKGKLNAGFVDTSNKLYSIDLKAGDVFVFPRGMVHYQQNIGRTPALLLVAFNSQSPGFVTVARATFGTNPAIPTEVLSRAFSMTSLEVEKTKKGFAGK